MTLDQQLFNISSAYKKSIAPEFHIQRFPNLNQEIINQIVHKTDLFFTSPSDSEGNVCMANHSEVRPEFRQTFATIDVLDYIYAVLQKTKETVQTNFPYPKNAETFWILVLSGSQLHKIHSLKNISPENCITKFNQEGDYIVTNPKHITTSNINSPLEECPQGGVVNTRLNQIIYLNKIPIRLHPILELPYNPKLKQRARELRQARNLSEVLFWMQVTKGGFHKIDFDRQRVIGNYIVDFYIKKLGLVIEIDGSSHDTKVEYDAIRENYLISLGLKVHRIKVADIMNNMNTVIITLENYIIENYGIEKKSLNQDQPPHPAGTPQKGNCSRVYINETQYFENVPEAIWDFYIENNQPAQKWLQDKTGQILAPEDIIYYQKIIEAIKGTITLKDKINVILD